ncbi:MAG: enoyl-CoA hydratase/isomerase family protein [Gammaproteobacteria bacterium]|jgi:3-hydroxyacyl-CoA dehydrogenase
MTDSPRVKKPASQQDVLFENEAARFWIADGDIGVLSFKTKMHIIGALVLDSLNRAVDIAEEQLAGMVLWHPDGPFSAGADLKAFMPIALRGLQPDSNALDELLGHFQQSCIRMRNSGVPVVAAVHGLALGGGCELMMQCDRTVAALESNIGLVEAGVGLIPAGSGCMELARRASLKAGDGDLFPHLKPLFEIVAMGKVATSAEMAREYGFLRESDVIVKNTREVLHAALAEVRVLNAAGYRQPPEMLIRAGGREAIASFRLAMTHMHEGGNISDHDLRIGSEVANALCGGAVEAGAWLDEERYLCCERDGFHRLIGCPETQARIRHTLDTGKHLCN